MSEPLVHTKETSPRFSPQLTYRENRVRLYPFEYQATEKLYQAIDLRDGKNRFEQLSKCRTFAFFVWHEPTGTVRVSSNSCRLRWCPICAGGKSRQVAHELKLHMKALKEPKFLTLTQKHSNAPLKHQIKTLYDSFVKLRNTKIWKKNVKGGIWFFQIKKSSETGQWHPHIHVMIDSTYIWQKTLSDLWLSITMTSKVIDIRIIRDIDKSAEYIARYSSRPSVLASLEENERCDCFDALHGRRLSGAFGNCRGKGLTTPILPNHSEYVKLGSFEDIRDLIDDDIHSRNIWKAWLSGGKIENPHKVYSQERKVLERETKPWLYYSYDDFDWSDNGKEIKDKNI